MERNPCRYRGVRETAADALPPRRDRVRFFGRASAMGPKRTAAARDDVAEDRFLAGSRRDRSDHSRSLETGKCSERPSAPGCGPLRRDAGHSRNTVMAMNGSGLGAESASAQPKFNRSMAALLADLADQVTTLFRQEVGLFKAELMEKLGLIGKGVGAIAGGALIAFSGWLALVMAAVLGLSLVVEPWLAALIVGLVLLGIGGALVYFGKSRFDADSLAMRRTVASLREDEAWVRERLS